MVVCGILCALVVWQVAFADQRITKIEGVLGALASLLCATLNIMLLLDGVWVYPIVVVTICIMVGIMMVERPEAEGRARAAMRKLGP